MGDGAQVLRHGSLFSGIGGFDLAAEWVGWENIFHCELDPFCRQVLNYYYPKTQSYGDIKETDFSSYRGRIDILTGGFPCQPYSTAGKRLGKEDPRHLWPDMLRAIREIQPLWVVGENVRGLISWNGGLVFHEVQSDLEAEGYEVLPFLLPAAGVNAPHRRERIWFIAYSGGIGRKEKRRNSHGKIENEAFGRDLFIRAERSCEVGTASDTDSDGGPYQEYNRTELSEEKREFSYGSDHGPASDTNFSGLQETGTKQQAAGFEQHGELGELTADASFTGLEGQTGKRVQTGTGRTYRIRDHQSARISGIEGWENFPQTQPTVCIGNDGISDQLDIGSVFEGIPFPVKPITFSKWRTESIKALGNAIVPQVALLIFKTIQELQIKFQMQRP